MKILTSFNVGWMAVDDDTYDGAPDSHCPIGLSTKSQWDAIRDLVDQLEEIELEKNDDQQST